MEERYQIKTEMLGLGNEYAKELKRLNRIVRWDQQKGLISEVDPRNVEISLGQLNCKVATIVTTPGARRSS